jgi:hypothetical protein
LSIVEDVRDGSTDGTQDEPTNAGKARGTRRPRLSPEEQREVARLYGDSSISTAVIRGRFGIGESSLYRVVQRQGVPLRGRSGPTPGVSTTQPQRAANGRQKPATSSEGQPASPPASRSAIRKVGASQTGDMREVRRGPGRAARTAVATTVSDGSITLQQAGSVQFRIRYFAERVFEAKNIQDALRQANSMGATDITSVTRME